LFIDMRIKGGRKTAQGADDKHNITHESGKQAGYLLAERKEIQFAKRQRKKTKTPGERETASQHRRPWEKGKKGSVAFSASKGEKKKGKHLNRKALR